MMVYFRNFSFISLFSPDSFRQIFSHFSSLLYFFLPLNQNHAAYDHHYKVGFMIAISIFLLHFWFHSFSLLVMLMALLPHDLVLNFSASF